MKTVIVVSEGNKLSQEDRADIRQFLSTRAGRNLLGVLTNRVKDTVPSVPVEGSNESNYSFQAGRVRGANDVLNRIMEVFEKE